MIKTGLFRVMLILTLSCASAWAGDITVVSMQAGECSLGVEANEEWHTLRLRALHPRYQGCEVTLEQMISVLSAAFLKTGTPSLRGNYTSISIGRLIDYPWLSQYLAEAAYRDPGWNSRKGKPVKLSDNNYVSQLLFNRELLAPIQTLLAEAGYRIVGVSVEKVLVGRFREVPLYRGDKVRGEVPYDAQVWFRLQKMNGIF